MAADDVSPIAIACDMNAFDAEQRHRYQVVRTRVRTAITRVRELTHGFALELSADAELMAAAGEWIALERRCCPFFTFVLELPSGTQCAELRITGPEPAKELLRDALYPRPDIPADRLDARRR
jgi:hypothetical protein